jgi:hypothetical protein
MVAHARRAGEIAGRPMSGEAIAANYASVINGATISRNWRATLSEGMWDSQAWSASSKRR